jgi:nucleoside-diphosphate-sugar epimerase
MKLLVTGARGFLGWRTTALLGERGHDVRGVSRAGGAPRGLAGDVIEVDAGDLAVRELAADCDAVLHFAGIPDPARGRADPAWAVRQNAGTTLNLLEACSEHGVGLVYPSTVRAEAPPDPYALSKRLGEETCRLHAAPSTVVRLTSVFGPGQVAWEGATGAIASFAACALDGVPIVIPGNAERTRDFVYVDDVVLTIEEIVAERRWDETITLASGTPTPLVEAARLVRDAADSESTIETSGGPLPAGEDTSYAVRPDAPGLRLAVRPLEEAVRLYVDWLRDYAAAQGHATRP